MKIVLSITLLFFLGIAPQGWADSKSLSKSLSKSKTKKMFSRLIQVHKEFGFLRDNETLKNNFGADNKYVAKMALGQLSAKSIHNRIIATQLLGVWGGEKAIAPLIKRSLSDSDHDIRTQAAKSISQLTNNKAPELLTKQLKSKKLPVIARTVDALHTIGDNAVAENLFFMLNRGGSEESNRFDAYIWVGEQKTYIKDWDRNDEALEPVIGTYGTGSFLGVNDVVVTEVITVKRVIRKITTTLNSMELGFNSDDPKAWLKWRKDNPYYASASTE